MPTAIMVICTDGGFVIASDGKGSGGSTCEQKIFPTKDVGAMAAYGVSGAASCPPLTPTGTDHFVEVYKDTAKKLESETVADLDEYADKFSNRVGQRLPSDQGKEYELRIDFAGYFNGVPSMAIRKISFGAGTHKISLETNSVPAHIGCYQYVGSERVMYGLLHNSLDLDEFKSAGFEKLHEKSVSLGEAKECAKNYIRACISEEGHSVDPNIKESIGGEIALATITPTKGFDWCHRSFPLG
ncbi:MAG: hypothetical protein WAJ92_06330 [Candidatus Acidiferrales bacterium]